MGVSNLSRDGGAPLVRRVAAVSLVAIACSNAAIVVAAEPSEEPLAAVGLEQSLVEAIATAEPSVVAIISRVAKDVRNDDFQSQFFQDRGNQAYGVLDEGFSPGEFASGVVVDSSGLVLTNYHALKLDGEHWVITRDRRTLRARIRAADPRSDLAVLEIDRPNEGSDFQPIAMGDASRLRKGQIVVALGNPYTIARDGQASASWGIVSNLARKLHHPVSEMRDHPVLHHLGTLIQTDAKLSLGTSGGALVNLRGEMVGLTTSLAALSGYEQAAGYAVPIDEAFLAILERLKQGREVEYGFLGVSLQPAFDYATQAVGPGARILTIGVGTPARRGGLLLNDLVTHVNGVELREPDDLRLQVGKLLVPCTVTLTVIRDGRKFDLQVPLAKFRVTERSVVTNRPPDWRGMRVDYPTALFPPELLTSEAEQAVAIAEVAESSPCQRAGLVRNMLILAVNGQPVATPDDFRREVAAADGDVSLLVAHSTDRRRTVVVAP